MPKGQSLQLPLRPFLSPREKPRLVPAHLRVFLPQTGTAQAIQSVWGLHPGGAIAKARGPRTQKHQPITGQSEDLSKVNFANYNLERVQRIHQSEHISPSGPPIRGFPGSTHRRGSYSPSLWRMSRALVSLQIGLSSSGNFWWLQTWGTAGPPLFLVWGSWSSWRSLSFFTDSKGKENFPS